MNIKFLAWSLAIKSYVSYSYGSLNATLLESHYFSNNYLIKEPFHHSSVSKVLSNQLLSSKFLQSSRRSWPDEYDSLIQYISSNNSMCAWSCIQSPKCCYKTPHADWSSGGEINCRYDTEKICIFMKILIEYTQDYNIQNMPLLGYKNSWHKDLWVWVYLYVLFQAFFIKFTVRLLATLWPNITLFPWWSKVQFN